MIKLRLSVLNIDLNLINGCSCNLRVTILINLKKYLHYFASFGQIRSLVDFVIVDQSFLLQLRIDGDRH